MMRLSLLPTAQGQIGQAQLLVGVNTWFRFGPGNEIIAIRDLERGFARIPPLAVIGGHNVPSNGFAVGHTGLRATGHNSCLAPTVARHTERTIAIFYKLINFPSALPLGAGTIDFVSHYILTIHIIPRASNKKHAASAAPRGKKTDRSPAPKLTISQSAHRSGHPADNDRYSRGSEESDNPPFKLPGSPLVAGVIPTNVAKIGSPVSCLKNGISAILRQPIPVSLIGSAHGIIRLGVYLQPGRFRIPPRAYGPSG